MWCPRNSARWLVVSHLYLGAAVAATPCIGGGTASNQGVTGEVVSHGSAQCAGSFAVDNPHAVRVRFERLVQELVDEGDSLINGHAVEVDFFGHFLHGVVVD